MPRDYIHIRRLKLWARVGVLPYERELGQWFEVNLSLGLDLNSSNHDDSLDHCYDYSLAIQSLQSLTQNLVCFTIEAFSEHCLDKLEELYGPLPIRIEIIKCNAPILDFSGEVSVEKYRRW
uniref:Putative dihydroneopterin aldolase n=1 Tax=Paulinella micropora TaxID=1928728 RepID=A0A385I1G8_9EUKA|nr:putative dihydroneopterin aldolase [Paulinella micropora]AXY63773.1 putative dihydroneopterin aldolase [Paulinella micropora]